jgi:chorismate synthase
MRQAIDDARRAKDTLGGVFEVVALGVPPGLGSHVHADRRLSGRILAAVGSIPAVKGVEVGRAFELAKARGTEVHDRLAVTDDRVVHETNRAGGIEGGISTGCPIVVRAAMKPISTTLTPLQSVDLATGAPATTTYERSDVCAVPRASVVGEAMLSFVLADALLEKLGGDSLDEMRPRFESLRQGRLPEFQLGDRPWRFDYDPET